MRTMGIPSTTRRTLFQCLSLNSHRYRHWNSRHVSFHRCFSSFPTEADTLIVGAGPVGSSTAYHLAQSRGGNGKGIVLLERDPTYRSASATLSAGGFRFQFSLPQNVAMSLYGSQFFQEHASEISLQRLGYLFLAATPDGARRLQQNHAVQTEIGCPGMNLLSKAQLQEQFPWLHVDDIELGSFGSQEGWLDPWALLQLLKKKNQAMGVTYLHAEPVGGTMRSNSSSDYGEDEHCLDSVDVLLDLSSTADSSTSHRIKTIQVQKVVNAAGAYANQVFHVLTHQQDGGDDDLWTIPVRGRKRGVWFFHCNAPDVPQVAPLTIDPLTGVYFRTEGRVGKGTFLCGVSPTAETDVDFCGQDDKYREGIPFAGMPPMDADVHLWEEVVWPALYHRVPAFGSIKLVSSWAGLYDYNTVDQNAIIGYHPQVSNLLLVTGFSGHGLQHGPAAGRAAAELLEWNRFATLDLTLFSPDRFLQEAPVWEEGIV